MYALSHTRRSLHAARPHPAAVGLSLSLALASVAVVAQSAPPPGWLAPEQPVRVVFTVPETSGTHLLVRIPVGAEIPARTGLAVFGPDRAPVPFRVVCTNEDSLHILAAVGSNLRQEFQVYCGRAGSGAAPAPSLTDPLPVGVSVYPSQAQGIPTSWERMRYMVAQSDRHPLVTRQAAFGALATPFAAEPATPHRRGGLNPVLQAGGHFLVSTAGLHRFSLDCNDAGFVLVDGVLTVSRIGERPAGAPEVGPPLLLKPGVHRLDVYTKTDGDPAALVGWQPPQSAAFVVLPAGRMVSATEVVNVRIERQTDPVHADFAFTVSKAYAFRDVPAVFIPVRFTSTTLGAGRLAYEWDFGDGRKGEDRTVEHTYTAPGRYAVRLTVRDADGKPYVCEHLVDCRMAEPQFYAFDAEVGQLPAVAYGSDRIEPELLVRSPDSPAMPLTVSWTVTGRAVTDEPFRKDIALSREPLRLRILSRHVEGITNITWSIEHAGIPLRTQRVRFLRPPFASPVERIVGERLASPDGDRLVLVPFEYGGEYRQPPITKRQAFGRLTCLDDSLATGGLRREGHEALFDRILGRIVDGPDLPAVRHVDLGDWYGHSLVYGPLVKLLTATAALSNDTTVAVLTVGLQDILGDTDPAEFERLTAALVDTVSATRGCPVVLATPPPYAASGRDVRAYAAAVQRVGQVRGIPVADLFSAFRCAGPEQGALFRTGSDIMLSNQGHHLAAQVIARALLARGERD